MKLVTYTFSEFKDIWSIYFGQLDKLLPEIKSVALSNIECNEYINHPFIHIYNNSDPYWKQWVDALNKIDDEYFIYMQEDFFLYQKPDVLSIIKYENFLKNNQEYAFVKFIKSDAVICNEKINDEAWIIDNNQQYIYSMQPSIWRKKDFINLYTLSAQSQWYDYSENYYPSARKLGIKGLYIYRGEPKRGISHYDSSIFPYIATGLCRKKWNVVEYRKELNILTKEYNINMDIRGYLNGY